MDTPAAHGEADEDAPAVLAVVDARAGNENELAVVAPMWLRQPWTRQP